MIATTWNDLMLGKSKFSGYAIYAISDGEGKAAYVGMTKDVRSRLIAHLNERGPVGSLLPEGGDLAVTVYSLEDVEDMHRARCAMGGADYNWKIDELPRDLFERATTERKKANAAEWYMVHVLEPYLNDRKAWHLHPDRAAPNTAKYLEALRKGAEEYESTIARELEALRKNVQDNELTADDD